MSDTIPIKPELIRWARERSGRSMAYMVALSPNYEKWESGDAQPTMKQLEKLATKTYTPLGYFFLPEPPVESLPIPDFRTTTDQRVARPSPHLLDTIQSIQMRQDWMHGFLIEQGEAPLDFVSSRTVSDSPFAVAQEIRDRLGLAVHWSRHEKTWEDALRSLVQRIEAIGIMVMISGVVENNTSRPLSVEEFRGFVLCDKYAPIIFINGADAKAAQMFTIVHELAHLWIGKEGLTGFQKMLPSENTVEKFCNKVAAEFLVPENEMKNVWKGQPATVSNFKRIAGYFKVSPIVVARRVLDLGLITTAAYIAFYKSYQDHLKELKAKRKKNGGDFYATSGSRLGKRFPAAVFSAAKEGRLPYRDAYQLTGLSGSSYDKFGKEFGYAL